MAKGKRSTQLPTQRAARGTRSSVIVPDNDSSDIEEFFDNARSPEAVLGNDPSRRSPRSSSKVEPAVAVGRPARASKQILRLSLPGQQQDDYDSHVPAGKYRPDLLGSPSELSKVSTLPPTPAITLRSDEVEITRQALAARDEQEKPIDADLVDFSAPADDDVGGDDLAPPAVDDDDDEFPEEPQIADSMVDESFQDRKPAARASLPDTDSEDDDKEGHGFAIAQNEAQEAAAETADKKKMKRVSIASDDKTPVPKNRGKKGQRVPIFSPRGIPIGNRMYQRIPIVEPSPVDAGDLRRSRRSKQKPLEFWRNERVEYGPADDDNFVEEIGDMPLPKAVMRAQDTPYRKRKDAGKSKTAHTKNEKAKRRASAASASDRDDDVAFDYSKLQKKYKGNLIESETANVWDDGIDELSDLKVVAYAANMEAADLPLSATRTREEGNIVGKAAQAFNVPSDPNDNYVGYIMGNLFLPPRGIKDAESVGPCSQTFTVCTGQKKAIEVAFADPDGPEGILEDGSAQRFMLGPGDLFRVPPGNTYRLQNHSKTKPCLLTWTIIRPRILQPPPQDQESTPYST